MNSDSNFSLSNLSRFAKFAWFVVGYNILVIIWGAFVRASKSGDGCGSHWPLCNGEFVPLEGSLKTIVEFSHRVTSGLDGPLVLVLLIWAFWVSTKGSLIRYAAALSFVMILVEGLIGMFLVKYEWVANNVSMNRAIVMSIHLVSTLILLFFLTLTAWFASGGKMIVWRGNERRALFIGIGLFLVGLVGMSGAVSALGNTLFPGRELSQALEQPDVPFLLKTFVWLQLWHPFLSVITSIYLIAFAQPLRSARNGEWTRKFANWTLLLIGTQIAFGLLNMFAHAPIWMQLVHLLLADLLWIALVLLSVSALSQSKYAEASEPQLIVKTA